MENKFTPKVYLLYRFIC